MSFLPESQKFSAKGGGCQWYTVCSGKEFWNSQITVPRKCKQSTVQFHQDGQLVRKKIKDQQAFQNEKKALRELGGQMHFPVMVGCLDSKKTIIMKHCGDPIMPNNIPPRCHEQIAAISSALKAHGILHHDLTPHNFVSDQTGVISLIDFGRSTKCDTSKAVQSQVHAFQQIARKLCNSDELEGYLSAQLPRVGSERRKGLTTM